MPQVKFGKVRKILLGVVVGLGIFSLGYLLGNSNYKASLDELSNVSISREVPPGHESLDFSLFWKVWDILNKSYVDKTKLDKRLMVYGAIEGMVASLGDPYTAFLPPDENKVVQEDLEGSFEGVGIQIGFKGTQLAVIAPLAGSPAEKVGIKPGDFIVGIKDEEKGIDRGTVGISLPDAVKAIRGKAGSKVTLALTRDGEESPILLDVVREKLDVPSLILSYVGENESIVHIRLLKFGGETDGEWDKVVNEVIRKGVNAVILDLRNNPGGYLQGAVDIAGEFLKSGSVVVLEEKSNGERNNFTTSGLGKLLNTPIVILVNEGSASASEILAGALRDIRKVIIVGENTFGKASIQEPQQLDGGAGLHITTARWLTPSGLSVDQKGIEPDVKIEDNQETSEDEQLEEAIRILGY